MTGRIRTIKPELIEDEATAGLSDTAFRLFVSMFAIADDHGILRASRGYLLGQVWHGCEPSEPIEDACIQLSRRLVTFFVSDGQCYAFIRNWAKHQRVNDAAKPRLPLPPGYEEVEGTRSRGNGKERTCWTIRRNTRLDLDGPGPTEAAWYLALKCPVPRVRAPTPIPISSPAGEVPPPPGAGSVPSPPAQSLKGSPPLLISADFAAADPPVVAEIAREPAAENPENHTAQLLGEHRVMPASNTSTDTNEAKMGEQPALFGDAAVVPGGTDAPAAAAKRKGGRPKKPKADKPPKTAKQLRGEREQAMVAEAIDLMRVRCPKVPIGDWGPVLGGMVKRTRGRSDHTPFAEAMALAGETTFRKIGQGSTLEPVSIFRTAAVSYLNPDTYKFAVEHSMAPETKPDRDRFLTWAERDEQAKERRRRDAIDPDMVSGPLPRVS
jgi:hypothetical protein